MDPATDVGTVIDEPAAILFQRRVDDAVRDRGVAPAHTGVTPVHTSVAPPLHQSAPAEHQRHTSETERKTEDIDWAYYASLRGAGRDQILKQELPKLLGERAGIR